MTNLERAETALAALLESDAFKIALSVVNTVVGQNQNPGCGGDGLMTVRKWQELRIILEALETLNDYQPWPISTVNLLKDTWAGLEPTPQQQVMEANAAFDNEFSTPITVVSAEPEGKHVFVLLSDDTILMSRELGNNHCAEIHAKQIRDLNLQPLFLVDTLKYEEAKAL